MSIKICCGILIILGFNCYLTFEQLDNLKNSLTFVIDDTGSMTDDIQQVKNGASDIFDTVLNSNASQIANFILVTFNDPNIKSAIITTDEYQFRSALDSILVDGGADCPELAMAGIEEALVNSLPGSYIYVFTDASAKDYRNFPRVKSIAQKKQSQIVFILTGKCGKDSDSDYRVYHELADATAGQVFHLDKNEIGEILIYVAETVKSRRTMLTSKKFPPGYKNTLNYTVDGKIKDVIISVSGENPKVDVNKPDGSAAKTKDIMKSKKIAIVKVSDIEPGVHTAKVGSESDTSAVVTGDTTVNFQQGFSVFKPTSMRDTTTKPVPDKQSYLGIELLNKDNDIELQAVEILDMNDNILSERPLYKVDGNFYVTEPTILPSDTFKIAIKGYITKTKELIRRLSSTPIEAQKPFYDKTINKAPTVTIDGEPLRKVMYGNALQLKCKVNGYPRPTVTWIDKKSKATLPSMNAEVDIPYDYISVLNLDQVKENTTYECRAFNDYGDDKKSVAVEADTKFTVLNVSNNTAINYEEEGKLYCLIDATPPCDITWYHNGEEMKPDDDIEKSSDGSVLTIYNMQPKFQGKYTCEAKNKFIRKIFFINLSMSGTASPKINKTSNEINVGIKQNIDINCRIIEGVPQPWIRWFFKQQSTHEFHKLSEESDILNIRGVNASNAGTYRCEAYNIFGKDVYEIDLIVEYPPTITFEKKSVNARTGERIFLPCKVDGVPKPDVKWTFNGVVIRNSLRQRIYRDNTLSFEASLHDTGTYLCEAVNKLGGSSKTVKVNVYEPVNIKPPVESYLEEKIGNSLTLSCQASGYPSPNIKWIYMDRHANYRILSTGDTSGALHISRVKTDDSGFYVCIANNYMGSANITYEVQILAPPSIAKLSSSNTFTAVDGDLVLRIPCQATGNPKAIITWMKNGLNIASGTKTYSIEEDGTLIIMNIDDFSAGTYVCSAKNSLGIDIKTFEVNVQEYPKPSIPSNTVYVEVGKTAKIECDIPHKRTDLLRWFKDSKMVSNGEMILNNVKMSDDGLYTCRVSNFTGASSITKRVIVGYKPKFLTEEDENVDFFDGMDAYLSCAANGEPTPKVTWWYNRKKLEVPDMIYIFSMSVSNIGQYSCIVSNPFGTISRDFEITTRECLLNIEPTSADSPAVISIDLRFGTFDSIDNVLRIPRKETVLLSCPGGFVDFPENEIEATCVRESILKIKDKEITFSEIKCKDSVKPIIKETGRPCARGDTEMVEIGYEISSIFLKVYEICYDKQKRQPKYSVNRIQPNQIGIEPKSVPTLFDSNLVPYNFNDLYDCSYQINKLSQDLGRWFHRDDKCCFAKRQLVNSRDVSPGLPQLATYSNLNFVPHWSTCVSKNWDDVEHRLRTLARSSGRDLMVLTGTSGQLQLPLGLSKVNIDISDRNKNIQQVPKFLWKVVQDEMTRSSLAIIQVNVPDLKLSEAYSYLLCKDICSDTEWMKNPGWRDVKKGYTYCCNIRDFERAFGFHGQFSYGMEGILKDSTLISEHSLT